MPRMSRCQAYMVHLWLQVCWAACEDCLGREQYPCRSHLSVWYESSFQPRHEPFFPAWNLDRRKLGSLDSVSSDGSPATHPSIHPSTDPSTHLPTDRERGTAAARSPGQCRLAAIAGAGHPVSQFANLPGKCHSTSTGRAFCLFPPFFLFFLLFVLAKPTSLFSGGLPKPHVPAVGWGNLARPVPQSSRFETFFRPSAHLG